MSPAQGDSLSTAQRPGAHRTGFFIGFDPLVYAMLSSSHITQGREPGGVGVSLRFGWGFSERWALVMDVPVTDLVVNDTADFLMAHSDIAVMYFPTALTVRNRSLVPFVQAGGGFRSLESTLYDGGTPRIYALVGEVDSIAAGLRYYECLGDTTTHRRHIAATSARVQAGLEWHLGRRSR